MNKSLTSWTKKIRNTKKWHQKFIHIPLWLWICLLIVTAVAVTYFNSALPVNMTKVVIKNVNDCFTETGTIGISEDIAVIAGIGGKVSSICINEGCYVEAGQVIAELDARELINEKNAHMQSMVSWESQKRDALKQENREKRKLQAELDSTRLELARLNTQKELRQRDWENAQTLYAGQALAQNDLENARQAQEAASLAVQNAEIQIAFLENQLADSFSAEGQQQAQAMAEAEKSAVQNLETKIADCRITAPISGYISNFRLQNLSRVNPGEVIAIIKNSDTLTVEVSVLTSYAPYLRVGDSVSIKQRLKGKDMVYPGKIAKIYDFAEESISPLGLKEHRVKVELQLDEYAEQLKSGYEVEVEFQVFKAEQQLVIPNTAVFKTADKYYVFVNKEGHAAKQEITYSYRTNQETVIQSGVAVGDEIISDANIDGLQENIRIRAISEQKS